LLRIERKSQPWEKEQTDRDQIEHKPLRGSWRWRGAGGERDRETHRGEREIEGDTGGDRDRGRHRGEREIEGDTGERERQRETRGEREIEGDTGERERDRG